MIKEKKDIKQLLAQLNEFNWHHPSRAEEKFFTRDLTENQDNYYAQVAWILKNQFQQTNRQIEQILGISRRKVGVLLAKYESDFASMDEVMEDLSNGKNWKKSGL